MSKVSGEINVTTGNQTLPAKEMNRVWFKAPKANSGFVYIGWGSATVPDGSTNETSGWQLDKQEEIGPINADNLSQFSVIGTDGDDSLLYFVD